MVPFAALVVATLRFWREASAQRTHLAQLASRETALLRAIHAFIEASRISSARVIECLDETLRAEDPSIDVVLAFVPSGEELECTYASGARAEHYVRARLRRDTATSLPARAAAAGHRIFDARDLLIPTDRRALAIPMHDGDGLRAVMYVSSAQPQGIGFQDRLVRTVEHVASPYSLAIAREADRMDATYDGLTGLLSPRAFRLRLSDLIDRARISTGEIFTLWFIDTDHFKAVNDTHGHAVGDIVLQAMAELIRAHTIADLDTIGRNGGDEFCALISGTQKIIAIERAQRLCEAVRTLDFGVALHLSASIGVASYPYDARSASELLEVADAAMYHSKRAGRDRVSFSVHGTAFADYI